MNRYIQELIVCITFYITDSTRTDIFCCIVNVGVGMFFLLLHLTVGDREVSGRCQPLHQWLLEEYFTCALQLPGPQVSLPLSSALICLHPPLTLCSTIILFPLPLSFHCSLSFHFSILPPLLFSLVCLVHVAVLKLFLVCPSSEAKKSS